MTKLILFILILFSETVYSNTVKILFSYEQTENGYKMMVSNDEFCPVSFKIDFELTNLKSTKGNNTIFVVPAKTKNFVFTELEIITKGKYGFSYKTLANYGDHNLSNYDVDFAYNLPYEKGGKFKIYQGYNGKSTHHNENSLDFTMPVGTPILAAREGVVVKVIDSNYITCFEKKCAEYNNYIIIYHPDGTFSRYVHLKKGGSLVKEGDTIKQNDIIGYSGNVGWSNGPHLHFMVFMQKIEQQITLETKFKVNDGNELLILKEKETYTRNY
jgi:murein DD-endopeptidase MepM/ murein hydrolase activator NlpD